MAVPMPETVKEEGCKGGWAPRGGGGGRVRKWGLERVAWRGGRREEGGERKDGGMEGWKDGGMEHIGTCWSGAPPASPGNRTPLRRPTIPQVVTLRSESFLSIRVLVADGWSLGGSVGNGRGLLRPPTGELRPGGCWCILCCMHR
jgi:hypothetical protein